MALVKFVNEFIQRTACHFKPSTYFIHTLSPLPSILIPLPNRLNNIHPLLKQLINKQDFDLSQELQKITVKIEEQGKEKKVQTNFSSIHGLNFDEKTTYIIANQEGKVTLSKKLNKQSIIIGVILYSTVENSKVKTLSSRNYQNILMGLKICALISIIWVQRELRYSTRLQNHLTS